jgi:hypothetical protein
MYLKSPMMKFGMFDMFVDIKNKIKKKFIFLRSNKNISQILNLHKSNFIFEIGNFYF